APADYQLTPGGGQRTLGHAKCVVRLLVRRRPLRPRAGGEAQAHRGDLPREHLLRSLLRHLPQGAQPARRTAIHCPAENPHFTNVANGADASNPFRLDRSQANTADQSHAYRAEQQAFDGGKMDLFPEYTGRKGPPPGEKPPAATKGLTMGYFDGNTVTALWNYAQHFAMSDRSFGSTFGPST